jgi:hypothetical protein
VAENVALGMDNPPPMRELAAKYPRCRKAMACRWIPPAGGRSVGGRTAAGGDHPLPAARPEASDHGRTDQRSDPARGGTSCSAPCGSCPSEGTAILYISHKLEEIRACATRPRSSARQGGGHLHTARKDGARDGRTDGRQALTPPEKAGWPRGEVALGCRTCRLLRRFRSAPAEGHLLYRRQGRGAGHRRCGRATGRTSCCWPCRESALGPGQRCGSRAMRRVILGRTNGASGRVWWPRPKERYGHAAAPDMSLVENALPDGGVRKGLTKNGFIDWAGPAFRRGDHRRL